MDSGLAPMVGLALIGLQLFLERSLQYGVLNALFGFPFDSFDRLATR